LDFSPKIRFFLFIYLHQLCIWKVTVDLLESTGSLWDNDVTVVLFYFQLLRHTSTVVTSPGVSRISPHQCHV